MILCRNEHCKALPSLISPNNSTVTRMKCEKQKMQTSESCAAIALDAASAGIPCHALLATA